MHRSGHRQGAQRSSEDRLDSIRVDASLLDAVGIDSRVGSGDLTGYEVRRKFITNWLFIDGLSNQAVFCVSGPAGKVSFRHVTPRCGGYEARSDLIVPESY